MNFNRFLHNKNSINLSHGIPTFAVLPASSEQLEDDDEEEEEEVLLVQEEEEEEEKSIS